MGEAVRAICDGIDQSRVGSYEEHSGFVVAGLFKFVFLGDGVPNVKDVIFLNGDPSVMLSENSKS